MGKNEIAQEIKNQIGQKAIVMMGASFWTAGARSLTFKVGRGAKGKNGSVTHVKVTLEPTDTYRIETFFVRGASFKTREVIEGATVDMLHPTIESFTGMYLSIG